MGRTAAGGAGTTTADLPPRAGSMKGASAAVIRVTMRASVCTRPRCARRAAGVAMGPISASRSIEGGEECNLGGGGGRRLGCFKKVSFSLNLN